MQDVELIKTIERFRKERLYDYALMINGRWGCGKSYFIKNKLIPSLQKKEDKPQIIYISLFGIKDADKISDMILYEKLKSDMENKHPEMAKGIQIGSTIIQKIAKAVVKDAKDYTEAFFSIYETFTGFDNNVIIIDDLERCSCDVNESLGAINNLVEHSNASVIVVANEEEIGMLKYDQNRELQMMVAMNQSVQFEEREEPLSFQDSRPQRYEEGITTEKLESRRKVIFGNTEYQRTKEKVIGQTIEYTPDLKTVFKQLISQINNEVLKKCLTEEIDRFEEFAIKDNHSNLRTFQFFLDKVSAIFDSIENKYESLHKSIVEYCYRSSIRCMSGLEMPKWEEEIGTQHFGNMWLTDTLTGYRFIDKFIQSNYIDSEFVNDLLSKYEEQVAAEAQGKEDPFRKIQNWTVEEDETVEKNLYEIESKIKNQEYSVYVFPKLLQIIVAFEAREMFVAPCKEIWESMKEYVKTVPEDKLEAFICEEYVSLQDDEKCKKLFSNRQQELADIINSRIKSSEKNKFENAIKSDKWAEELLDLSTKDSTIRGHSFIYWLNPEDLFQLIKECNNEQLYSFRYVLHSLYKSNKIFYPNAADDIKNLKHLLKLIEDMDVSTIGQIKQRKIDWLKDNLRGYIKLLGGTIDTPVEL